MDDAELERRIRQAGYDVQWERAPDSDSQAQVYALRDGKRHTQGFKSLLDLCEHVGRIDRPVRFMDDAAAVEAAMARHVERRPHFTVRTAACRVALFNGIKYIELVSTTGDETAMYELRPDSLRKMSNSNLPAEVVTAFDRARR